ncbi:Eco57I restriction-modification methylase domain-containing protein [Capnocytophaga sputigena]|uniref:Eco57I restriction-modification methylase domain-containing protein n=1 Tax=Capnocytophaga sputigena TaxID=1019 RepID=UPI00288A5845|nr:Eco57I restriction-modification methylase domain-containing protein [Capnocytophaga sputigena]
MNQQPHTPDILECLANLSNDEVFTSVTTANRMLDTLPTHLWSDPNAKFLDPFTKSGVFLREITKRLMKGLATAIPDEQERLDHILGQQLYGIGITRLTALTARRTLYCSKDTTELEHCLTDIFAQQGNPDGNIYFEPCEHTFHKGKCTYCGATEKEFGAEQRTALEQHAYLFIHNKNPYKEMQFDVIIGNPPYQMSDGGGGLGSSATPIYHLFIEQAIALNPRYLCMIVPSRWFAGGKGLDDFRDNMLKDRRIKEMHDFPNANDVFPTIDLSGGANYFLWDREYNGKCLIKNYEDGVCFSEMYRYLNEGNSDILIRYNRAIDILKKIQPLKEKSFSEIVSSSKPFGFRSFFRGKKNSFKNAVKIYVTKDVSYIKREEVILNQGWIDLHKVYIGKAYGERISTDYTVIGKPFYGEPNSCCTETYLVIGPFATEKRCQNVMSYIKTRFFRFLVLLKKPTQNTAKDTYQFVPQQDFDEEWTDEKLYKKYGLTAEEIAYIEKMVRPME